MGPKVLQGDIIVNSPRNPRPPKGMETIDGRIQVKGHQEAGQSGTDHGGRDREEAPRGGDEEQGGGGRGFNGG